MSRRFVRSLPNLAERLGMVLVCEDSDELRALLVGHLTRQRGLEVVDDVDNAGDALEAVRALRPDAILLDLVLGDTDPGELLLALAALDARPLVIVFSGLSPATLTPKARAAVDLHLDKTTPLREVAELVAEAITAHRAGERT
jgi:two-component system, NarL family, response regulator LiaR